MTTPCWSTILKQMVTTPQALAEKLQLPDDIHQSMLAAHQSFALRVPPRWLNKIPPGSVDHPLLNQILPRAEEMLVVPGYEHDPLAEQQANVTPGLLHKYHGRVLMIAAPTCPIHCRYCFRRHFNYLDNTSAQWQPALDYIAQNNSINEVILSGGDPLMLKNAPLDRLLTQLEAIPHLHTLRIHSRMPVVVPERIDMVLQHRLASSRLQICLVIHCNHALEIDQDVSKALDSLRHAGATLLNQSVLLSHVNNNLESLVDLSKNLWKNKVLPYYLHLPDQIAGTAHFDVTLSQAQRLVQQMRDCLPGYLVPKLAQEKPGENSKKIL